MPSGQRNVATYIHNICKWHLGSGVGDGGAGGGGLGQGCRHQRRIQLKTLTVGGKYSVSKYTAASTVQIYKIVSCRSG